MKATTQLKTQQRPPHVVFALKRANNGHPPFRGETAKAVCNERKHTEQDEND